MRIFICVVVLVFGYFVLCAGRCGSSSNTSEVDNEDVDEEVVIPESDVQQPDEQVGGVRGDLVPALVLGCGQQRGPATSTQVLNALGREAATLLGKGKEQLEPGLELGHHRCRPLVPVVGLGLSAQLPCAGGNPLAGISN